MEHSTVKKGIVIAARLALIQLLLFGPAMQENKKKGNDFPSIFSDPSLFPKYVLI